MRVRVSTFKPTGKWHTNQVVSLNNEWNQMIEQVRQLIKDGYIPGLTPGSNQDFIVLVQPLDGHALVPRLLNLDGGIEKQSKYDIEPTPIPPYTSEKDYGIPPDASQRRM